MFKKNLMAVILYMPMLIILKNFFLDFPGSPVVDNLHANARDTGSDLWSGKIPHALSQFSPRAQALQQQKPPQRKA